MAEPTTWTAGLFGGEAGGDELAEAERKVAILKAELEAVQAGRKEASAAELRKLERDYREAVAKVQQLRVAARPTVVEPPPARGVTTPRGYTARVGAAPGGGVGAVPGGGIAAQPPTGGAGGGGVLNWLQNLLQGVTTPRGYTSRVGAPPTGGVGAVPGGAMGVTTPRGYPTSPAAGAPMPQEGLRGGYGPPGATPPTAGLWRPSGGEVAASELRTRGLATGPTPRYGRAYIPPAAAGTQGLTEAEWLAQQRQMTEYQAGSLEQRQAEAQALQAYRMAQLGQGQAAAGATAAYRQQQAEQAKAQLMQAWAIAQQELAHAQNVMASQIGTGVAGMQSQQWAQGLPYALPKGTQVAPGYERGGPMQQLHRMSGSQFTPGVTGRISPQPGPSQQQMMQWVQQARGQFGAGG